MANSAKSQGALQVLRDLTASGTGSRKLSMVASVVAELDGDVEDLDGSTAASSGARDGALIAVQALRDGGASSTTIGKAMETVADLTPAKTKKATAAEAKKEAKIAKAEAAAQKAENEAEDVRNAEDDEDDGNDGGEGDDPPQE